LVLKDLVTEAPFAVEKNHRGSPGLEWTSSDKCALSDSIKPRSLQFRATYSLHNPGAVNQ